MHRVLLAALAWLILVGGCAAHVPQASSSGVPTPRDDDPVVELSPTTTVEVTSTTTLQLPTAVGVFDRPPLFDAAPTIDEPARVMVVGDSVTFELAPAILAGAEALGPVEAFNRTQVGLGLSRHETFVWWDVWAPFVDELRPDVVVMQVGLWDVATTLTDSVRDPQPEDPDWDQAFGALMDRAVEVFAEFGAHVYWLEMLPSPDAEIAAQMNRAVRDLATRDSRVSIVPLEPVFTDDGEYISETEAIFGPIPIRKIDQVHVCRTGAMLAGQVVTEALSHDFGLELVTGWELGDWRFDPRYDVDPCPDAV